MTECEYKFLLTERQFTEATEKAQNLYGSPQEKTQVNNYYDDETLSLNRRGVTVRIRQAGGAGKLQIKQHGRSQNGCAVSEEREHDIAGSSSEINLPELGRLTLKGCLVTRRLSFAAYPGISLDMDTNTYLGLTDYEVEIEFDDTVQEQAKAIISTLGLDTMNHLSKSERFFAALERKGGTDGI